MLILLPMSSDCIPIKKSFICCQHSIRNIIQRATLK